MNKGSVSGSTETGSFNFFDIKVMNKLVRVLMIKTLYKKGRFFNGAL
jgi:hypothetical protein